MPSTLNKKKKVKKQPKGIAVFKQMIEDKRTISAHLKNGGTFKELKEKGYRFATV
jgi:hypothetical protein